MIVSLIYQDLIKDVHKLFIREREMKCTRS